MYDRLRTLKTIVAFTALTLYMVLVISTPQAHADSRIAGTKPGVEKKVRVRGSGGSTQKVIDTNIVAIESLGTLSNIRDGGLGIDVWEDTPRSFLINLLQTERPAGKYKTLNDLHRRALLTRLNPKLIDNDITVEPGQDLLTLRLEALIRNGNFSEAAEIYGFYTEEPYHPSLAKAGVKSIVFNGDTSLACLETKAVKKRFSDMPFWQDMAATCDYIFAKLSKNKKNADKKDNESEAEEESATSDSDLIKKIVGDDKFRYKVSSDKDIDKLSDSEILALFADKRFDFSKLKSSGFLSPFLSSLVSNYPQTSNNTRYNLLVKAVGNGTKSAAELVEFYKDTKFDALGVTNEKVALHADHKGWRKLAFFYQSLAKASGSVDDNLVLALISSNGDTSNAALIPFARYINDVNPTSFTNEQVRKAIRIQMKANNAIGSKWLQKWNQIKTGSRNDILLDLAIGLNNGLSTKQLSGLSPKSFNSKTFSNTEKLLLDLAYEKLDKNWQVVNYTPRQFYEKQIDLTLGNNYVMPSNELVDYVDYAKRSNRVGEISLLSGLALYNIPAENIYPGFLADILEGYGAVGLTKDARDLTKEIVLGLMK